MRFTLLRQTEFDWQNVKRTLNQLAANQ